MTDRFILLTGCSSGGKSSLLRALEARGFAVVQEPGRRIVAEEIDGTGDALPWVDFKKFASRAVEMAQSDLHRAKNLDGTVFFDRGLIDAAVALQFAGGAPYRSVLGESRQYFRKVFLAPPWPEIYEYDNERKHGFQVARDEFLRLENALTDLGYVACELPKASVPDRIEFVLNELGVC